MASCGQIQGPVRGEVVATDAPTRLLGGAAGDVAGYGLLGEHDLTGDGVADLVVASMYADTAVEDAGIVYVVPGPVSGVVELGKVATRVLGADHDGWLGWGLAAGDVTGDGQADLVIGASTVAPKEQLGVGKAFVVAGPVDGELDLATDALATIVGSGTQHYLGASAAVADLNGDGVGDVMVGAYGAGENRGAVHVVHGPPAGLVLAENAPLTYVGDQERDQIGYTLAQLGDVDGDGAGDVATSTRDWGHGGGAWVVFGAL